MGTPFISKFSVLLSLAASSSFSKQTVAYVSENKSTVRINLLVSMPFKQERVYMQQNCLNIYTFLLLYNTSCFCVNPEQNESI